ncbi:MAG TPA: hypothetical protein VHP38_02040 [Ruminiclostridium sp.]|nr:hypothetical protein [Ruminiclostridium sp.]
MVKFPVLAILMAAHEVNKKKLASIIDKTPGSVTGKLSGRVEWKRPDMVKIVLYFKEFYPTITVDKIFCLDGNNSYQTVEDITKMLEELKQKEGKALA